MNIWRALLSTAVLSVAALATAQPATYGGTSVPVNAGVLLLDSDPGTFDDTVNPVPHVFYMMDRDSMVKPARWNIVNPLAPGVWTQPLADRWSDLGPPALGSQITKRDAPYWEVDLKSTSSESLAQYDVLLLPTGNANLVLNSQDREKLRLFVDQGGVLWVEVLPPGNLGSLYNGLFYPFEVVASGDTSQTANLTHPLMSSPNQLELDDVLSMGAFYDTFATPIDPSFPNPGSFATISANSAAYEPVIARPGPSGFESTVMASKVGAGHVVVSTLGISQILNRGYDPSNPSANIQPNQGIRSFDPLEGNRRSNAAKRFVSNLIAFSSASSSPAASSRGTSSVAANVPAPLLQSLEAPFNGNVFEPFNPPAIANGLIIVTAGNEVLAYDADPNGDRNLDGDPDDGLPDVVGSPGDLIWRQDSLGGPLSPPTVAEVTNTSFSTPNQVFVVSSGGDLNVLALETGQVLTSVSPPQSSTGGNRPPAPTVHENVVVVGGSASAGFGDAGTLWLLNLNTIGSPTGDEWFLENSGQLRVPTASPTVGYIPIQDNSGGMDRVVYVPTAPENSTSAGLTSVWLGSVGEQPTQVTLSGSTLRVRTRAALNGMPLVFSSGPSSYGIRISLVFPDGTPAADGVYSSVINGNPSSTGVPGEFQVDVNPGSFDLDQSTPDPSDDLSLRVDYTVDWGQAQGGSANADTFVRGRVGFPDTSARSRQVVGNLALAPSGNVIAVVSDPSGSTPGGAIYNLFENGRGVFNVAYRWDLHDRITIDRQNGDPLELGPAVLDEDPLSQDIGAGEFNGLHFVSGAAVRDGLAYVMAQGSRPLNNFGGVNAPAGVIMAFEADPEPVQFTIPAAAAEGIGLNDEENPNLVLAQPDLARSTNTSDPEIDTILGNVVLEKSPAGSIRVTLPSLSQSQRGDLNSVLSTSLPVLVRVTNPVGEIAVLPEAAGGSTDITLSGTDSGSFVTGRASGRFTPLAWYAVMNGFQGQATPAVGGRTLYVTGASVLPGIIATGNPFSPRGSLYAFDTQTNAANRFVNPNSDRPWMPQLYFVLRDGPGPFNYEAAEPVLWPQIDGIDDFDDLRIRILQTSVDGSESYNLAVGDGTVSITADDALYSFRQSNFLVVDEGRVSMFDPAGNPLWSTDQTLGSGQILPATSASNYTRLSRPTRLYPSEQDGFWIVDTGNDRVVRIDSAGRERRLIKQLQTSPYYVPRGWREGSRRVLRQPMDVLTYTTTRGAAEVAAAFPGEIQVNPDGSRTAPGSPRAAELWRHAIVADAGNRRIVEVVDRYWLTPDGQIEELVRYADPDTDEVIPALNVVWWHTPEELTGSNYRYSSLGRAQVGSGPDRRSVIGFGFSNVEPGRATFDAGTQTQDVYSGNSGIVLFDENTGQSQVITEFGLPAIPGGAFLADTGGITLDQSPLNSFTFNSPARAETARPISGLRSLTLSYVPDGSGGYTLAAMFTDNTGVYEVWDPEGDGLWSVRWMMPEEAFLGLRRPQGGGPFDRGNLRRNPSRFAPTYAERLNLSEVIVVNGYLGETLNGADYTGEVVLLEGAPGAAAGYDPSRPNLGFSPLSVKFELPPVQNIRGIVNPVFAQRQ